MGYYSKQHSSRIIANQTLQSTGGSTAYQSNGVGSETFQIRLATNIAGGVWVKIDSGANATAGSDTWLAPNVVGEYFQCIPRNDGQRCGDGHRDRLHQYCRNGLSGAVPETGAARAARRLANFAVPRRFYLKHKGDLIERAILPPRSQQVSTPSSSASHTSRRRNLPTRFRAAETAYKRPPMNSV